MEHGDINMCLDDGPFVYTTEDLLKNLTFSSGKCAPFKFEHYAILKRLSNGILHKAIDASVLDELKKFNFKIDRLTGYITNIFEYEFVVLDHDLSVVHVVNAESKIKLGHLNVSINSNDPTLLLITATADRYLK
ncbi:cyun122 [Cyclophragma undans nucleopolyhedrovirus]|uniref:Cyun122 n=1 Tax=Cyclophragma undans nucleopolyhedrovirus TaxID=1906244 RepID=A0A288Q7L1_9ABAC|nr:cyun122 [Cyclophragma undans nucleopolyhedrovirus]AOT85580.1 cyun122 [Cyclophragma undans nucleopolyhedrovirus]